MDVPWVNRVECTLFKCLDQSVVGGTLTRRP